LLELDRDAAPQPAAFNATQAERAAQLFNSAGRKRASRWDCMIAAAAIETGARLATRNGADFRRFKAAGLDLVAI
jgi:predicted nucleic acid-binding protein